MQISPWARPLFGEIQLRHHRIQHREAQHERLVREKIIAVVADFALVSASASTMPSARFWFGQMMNQTLNADQVEDHADADDLEARLQGEGFVQIALEPRDDQPGDDRCRAPTSGTRTARRARCACRWPASVRRESSASSGSARVEIIQQADPQNAAEHVENTIHGVR